MYASMPVMRAATALQRNKTGAHDAETLAQLIRTGWYREARVKGWAAHAMRRLVGGRSQLVGISIDLSNQVRSTLKTFGLRATGGAGRVFEAKVRAALEGRPEVARQRCSQSCTPHSLTCLYIIRAVPAGAKTDRTLDTERRDPAG
jgi:transposase